MNFQNYYLNCIGILQELTVSHHVVVRQTRLGGIEYLDQHDNHVNTFQEHPHKGAQEEVVKKASYQSTSQLKQQISFLYL